MGLVRGGDGLGFSFGSASELACDPEGFEVGEGSSTGEVAKMLGQVKHFGEGVYSFDLHGGAGAATIESVVVGIDRHR